MSAAHTPGPWKIRDLDWPEGYRIQAVVGSETEDICQVTNVPDARLIAAAPRMLEAIELLAEWRDVLVQNYPDMPSLVRAAHLARAILRDVEGESNG